LTSYFPSSSAAAPGALVALVLLFCVLLLFEQRRLLAELDKRDNRLDKIMHDHGERIAALTQALGAIRGPLVRQIVGCSPANGPDPLQFLALYPPCHSCDFSTRALISGAKSALRARYRAGRSAAESPACNPSSSSSFSC
jgi:hypothetical protein